MTIVKELTLVNKYGMHVRPAGALAKACQKYACDVTVENAGVSVSGKSVLGLMTLEAPVGTVLTVTAAGGNIFSEPFTISTDKYSYGVGEPLVKGGRYDSLLSHFGKDSPAIGFAITVDQLMLALERQ